MFTWLDYAIIAVLILSVFIGLLRGFIKETLSLVSWVAAAWVAALTYKSAANWLTPYINVEAVRQVAAFLIIFFACIVIGSMLNFLMSIIVNKSGLGGTDRVLGIAFGLGRGVLVVALVLLVVRLTSFKEQAWWKDSVLVPQFEPIMAQLEYYIPVKGAEVKKAADENSQQVAMPAYIGDKIKAANTMRPS